MQRISAMFAAFLFVSFCGSGCSEEVVSASVSAGTQPSVLDDATASDYPNASADAEITSDTELTADTGIGFVECKSSEDCADQEESSSCEGWVCQEGTCISVLLSDGMDCDDGNACTSLSTCAAGACISPENDPCNDGNGCTQDSCDPSAGCINEEVTVACDDGNPCTNGDTCAGGVCSGTVLDCEDNNGCTDDSCDVDSGCIHVPNEIDCDDANVCTLEDTCNGGFCVGEGMYECDDGDPCTDDVCDEKLGCVYENNAVPCDDADPCTKEDVCADGQCAGVPLICDDGFYCTLDICTDEGSCNHIAQNDLCPPVDDSCTEVACDVTADCVYTANDGKCDDGVACTKDFCVQGAGCAQEADPTQCTQEGAECLVFDCKVDTGCESTPSDDLCDDGIACTLDGCTADTGLCSFNPVKAECVDPDTNCFEYQCDPVLGCLSESVPESCNDGIACTADSCGEDGLCVFEPSIDFCEGLTGECLIAEECSTTNGCVFTQSHKACDDGVECTEEICAADGSCSNLPDSSLCDDGNVCTDDLCTPEGCTYGFNEEPCSLLTALDCGGDKCVEGACQTMYWPSCGDSDKCIALGTASFEGGDGLCNPLFQCLIYGFDQSDCLNPCPSGQIKDCEGECRTGLYLEFLLGDGVCNENMNCSRFGYDAGACGCEPGSITDCNGVCHPLAEIGSVLGNGNCDVEAGNGENPVLACGKFGYDDHDCILDEESSMTPGFIKGCDGVTTSLDFIVLMLASDDPCTAYTNCEIFDFGGGACFENCEAPSVPSCLHDKNEPSCVPMSYVVPKLGNGSCDYLLDCERFGYDAGDCSNDGF